MFKMLKMLKMLKNVKIVKKRSILYIIRKSTLKDYSEIAHSIEKILV